MQILKSSCQTQSPDFKGIHIANSTNWVKNIETSIDLYQITNKDRDFLKKLQDSVDMKRLMPDKNISKAEYDR